MVRAECDVVCRPEPMGKLLPAVGQGEVPYLGDKFG